MDLDGDVLLRSLAALDVSGLAEYQSRLIASARKGAASGQSLVDRLGTELLAASFSPLETALRPEIAKRLAAVPMIAVNVEVCNASTVFSKPEPHILIYRGLIRATIFYLELDELADVLLALDGEGLAGIGCDERELKALVGDSVQLLGAYLDGEAALPWLGIHLTPADQSSVFIAFSKAMWFVAMHELGHIEFGHESATGHAPPLLVPNLPVEEEIDLYKQQEFQADTYVLESLKDEYRWQAGSFALRSLQLIALQELWLGGSQRHPLAPNRLQWFADTLRNVEGEEAARELEPFIASSREDFTRGRARRTLGAGKTAPAALLLSVERLAALYKLVEPAETISIDLDLGRYFSRIVSEWWVEGSQDGELNGAR